MEFICEFSRWPKPLVLYYADIMLCYSLLFLSPFSRSLYKILIPHKIHTPHNVRLRVSRPISPCKWKLYVKPPKWKLHMALSVSLQIAAKVSEFVLWETGSLICTRKIKNLWHLGYVRLMSHLNLTPEIIFIIVNV